MYIDMWRILRKRLAESYGTISYSQIMRMMDNIEAQMQSELNWQRNGHKALKHLRKIETWDGGLSEDHIDEVNRNAEG
jgi:DNA-directed RNA polymerase subunit F